MSAHAALESAARAVSEMLTAPDSLLSNDQAVQVRSHIADAVRRVRDGAPGTVLRASDLARRITDAGGPGSIRPELATALARLEEASAAASELRLIPRPTLRGLRELGVPVSAQMVARIVNEAVLLPNLSADDDNLSVPQMRADDGRTFIPVFSDRGSHDHWADGADVQPRAVMIRIADAGDLLLRTGSDGLVVNPLQENVVLGATAMKQALGSVPISPGTELSYGLPATMPDGLETSVIAALRSVPGAFAATIVNLVHGDAEQRLAVVVAHEGDGEPVQEFGRALGLSLGASLSIDVLDGTSDLGRRILADLPALRAN